MSNRPPAGSSFLDRLGISAVIFDLDGVLIDSMPFHYEAYRRLLAEEGLPLERMEIYLREGLGSPDVIRSLAEDKGWAFSPERIEELAQRRRQLFYQVYQHRVFTEVPEILTWLSQAGYRLAVVSAATQKSLDVCLNQYPAGPDGRGLGQWFPLVISGTHGGARQALSRPLPESPGGSGSERDAGAGGGECSGWGHRGVGSRMPLRGLRDDAASKSS